MFRILKNVVRVNSTEKEILLGVEFTFTLCVFFMDNNDRELEGSERHFVFFLVCEIKLLDQEKIKKDLRNLKPTGCISSKIKYIRMEQVY